MGYISVFLSVVVILYVSFAEGQKFSKAPPGSELEEAPFRIERFLVDYDRIHEERLYPGRNWVCTQPTSKDEEEASEQAFWKLFSYIDGQNDQGTKIEMTTPAIMKYKGSKMYEMCFYIGEKHQQLTPRPLDRSVYITNSYDTKVFASRFGGFASDAEFEEHAKRLRKYLVDQREPADFKMVIRADYNNPWDRKRRNEVWYQMM